MIVTATLARLNTPSPAYVDLASFSVTSSYHPYFDLYYADIRRESLMETNNDHFKILKSGELEGLYEEIRIWYYDEQEGEFRSSWQIDAEDNGWKYQVFDPDVEAGNSYYYKLEDVDIYGISSQHGPLSVTVSNP